MASSLKDYRISITQDRMAVRLDCPVPPTNMTRLAGEIWEELDHRGIKKLPSPSLLTQMLIRGAKRDPQLQDYLLLQGEPPTPPIDGRIEWSSDYFSNGFMADEQTGSIDYRKHKANASVAEGQLVARIRPSKEGKCGTDLYGKPVHPRPARRIKLKIGINLRLDRDKGEIFAEKCGRIRKNGSVLFVDEVYAVEGNIGLATGHITHPGALEVNGDIEEGSQVETTGAIDVEGTVEAARIKTRGSLTVHGGITRSNEPGIEVAADLQAKFINGSTLRVAGDLLVEREIVNSQVLAGGKVTLPMGRVVGGEVKALGGFDVGQLGSGAAVPTIIMVGHADQIFSKQKEIEDIQERIGYFHEILREQLAAGALPASGSSAGSTEAGMPTDLLAHVLKMENFLLSMETEMEVLRNEESNKGLQLCSTIEEDIDNLRLKFRMLLNLSNPEINPGSGNRDQEEALDKIAILEKKLQMAKQDLKILRETETRAGKRPAVYVRKKLHPNTQIHFDDQVKKFHKEHVGPLRIVHMDNQIQIQ